ncbi:MAG TPA: hypothetical protein VFJ07_21510 [Streptosporangiaceae bacterium]|nr:hypothetical protein [Streptosporangiaceae bacterium]
MTEDASEEAAWRDLVAHYATPGVADGTPAPWPTREDLPGPAPHAQEAADPDASGPDTADLDVSGLDMAGPEGPELDGTQRPGPRLGPRPGPFGGLPPGPPQIRIVRPASAVPPPGEDDDHFVPPVPPPLPRLDPVTKGAWVALFGGPLYLLVAVMASWQVPDWAAFCAVAAFVGGFATLVVRMGDRPPPDSGPDDGAVV